MPSEQQQAKVGFKTINALGCGKVCQFFVNKGIWLLALPYYQMTLGIDPFLLGLIVTIPMLLATACTPLVGYFSDFVNRKHGTRKHLIFIASIICGTAYSLIWLVPEYWSEMAQLSYLFCLVLLFNFSGYFQSIPLMSLLYEVTKDSNLRTQIIALTTFYVKCCAFIYQWAYPLTQLSIWGGGSLGIKVVGWFIGLVLIGVMGIVPAIFLKKSPLQPTSTLKHTQFGLRRSLKHVFANKTFLCLLLVIFCQTFGIAISAQMDFYLLVYYMHDGNIADGAWWKGALSSLYAATGFLALYLVPKMAFAFGKKRAMQITFLLSAIGGFIKWFVYVPGATWELAIDALICTSSWTSIAVLVPSIIADLCDKEQAKTNFDLKGMFISVQAWVQRYSAILVLPISGIFLNAIGFNAHNGGAQTDSTIQLMRIFLTGGTVLFSVLALLAITYGYTPKKRN